VEKAVPGEESLLQLPEVLNPGRLPEYFWGHIHPQALTSCLASLALRPGKESFVLDLCAAPGGKTAHLSEMMSNTGLVVANELYSTRRIPLGQTLARLGVLNAVITGYQAQEFPLRHGFDFVLADVPCSGEGRFRAWSESSWYEVKESKHTIHQLQKRIIIRAFDLLKEGGEMVYSTCTYDPSENEAVVQFLLENREAELLPVHLKVQAEPGIRSWKGEVYDRRMERAARFYPHRVNSVGFFMARIGRGRGAS
jgi:tRNA (cytosine49-C5)-methyltransferase